jgi:poly-gamma-glutamate synthesis protein (capsule biosynthesis protein)
MALLAVAWLAFWSLANPAVSVPAPAVLSVSRPREGGTGSVLVLGDTAPGDRTGRLLEASGPGGQLVKTASLLGAHDAAVVNLESPLTSGTEEWPVPKKYVYAADPSFAGAMKAAGIDAACLANNHVYDHGREGLADTLRHLEGAGVAHFGAHMSEAGARRGLVVETGGGRLGLLAYAQDKPRWRLTGLMFAMDTPFRVWPGVARMDYSDLDADIRRMRGAADAVAVIVHWGENYRPVDRAQEAIGRAAIELGADLVLGHHPHQAQPLGMHQGRPIVYSLGNYAFGTIGSRAMRFGMGVAVHMKGGRITALEIIPLATQNRVVKYIPRVPGKAALDDFFEELLGVSSSNGVEIERRGDRGWWVLAEQVE